jgi:hypothetical protein
MKGGLLLQGRIWADNDYLVASPSDETVQLQSPSKANGRDADMGTYENEKPQREFPKSSRTCLSRAGWNTTV